MSQHIIVWFRQDLRLNDNPALQSALHGKNAVIPVFIDDNDQAASRASWDAAARQALAQLMTR